jgi:hypothetical protein
MDLRLSVGVALAVLMAGCSGGDSAGAVTGTAKSVADAAAGVVASASDAGDWGLDTENSPIDGRVIHAKRNYEFADRGTWFSVEVKCVESTHKVGLSVESYGGSPSSTSPGSAYARKVASGAFGNVSIVLIGRAKPSGLNVRPISDLFETSDTFSNRLELKGLSRYDDVVRLPDTLKGADPSDINVARVVRDMLPLSLELNNGMGASELVIDASPQVLQALQACGGDGDLVTPQAAARLLEETRAAAEHQKADDERASAQAAQQAESNKAQEDADRAGIGSECRNKGSTTLYISGRRTDCTVDFPAETAAFNSDIDAIYAVAAKHGFLCSSRGSRDDLTRYASQAGLDAARTLVEQQWCGNLLKVNRPPAN